MTRMSWPVALVALGFIALVGVMFWRATMNMENFDAVWAAAGPVVGVVVGAVPGAVFGVAAHGEQRRAQERAEVYARHIPADRSSAVIGELPQG